MVKPQTTLLLVRRATHEYPAPPLQKCIPSLPPLSLLLLGRFESLFVPDHLPRGACTARSRTRREACAPESARSGSPRSTRSGFGLCQEANQMYGGRAGERAVSERWGRSGPVGGGEGWPQNTDPLMDLFGLCWYHT